MVVSLINHGAHVNTTPTTLTGLGMGGRFLFIRV